MRISDWSSDVCSSDLFISTISHNDSSVLIAQRPHIQRDRLIERLHRVNSAAQDYTAGTLSNHDRDMLPLFHDDLLMALLADEILQRVEMNLLADVHPPWQSTRVVYHSPHQISWAQFLLALNVFRSEEHTSELQSLMRISY